MYCLLHYDVRIDFLSSFYASEHEIEVVDAGMEARQNRLAAHACETSRRHVRARTRTGTTVPHCEWHAVRKHTCLQRSSGT